MENESNITTGSLGQEDVIEYSAGTFEDVIADLGFKNLPHAMMFFERDGSVSSMCAPEDVIGDKTEFETVKLALDFVHYAFDRPDWMFEYMKTSEEEKLISESEKNKPKLRLIKGGLDGADQSKE